MKKRWIVLSLLLTFSSVPVLAAEEIPPPPVVTTEETETLPNTDTAPPAAGEEPAAPADNISAVRPALTTEHIRYLQGFPDGTLHPDGSLTRAQTATMLYRLLADQTGGGFPCTYADTSPEDWFYPAVTTLCSRGILENSDRFRPTDAITRAELVHILSCFSEPATEQSRFSDVPETHWAAASISTAVQQGWIKGYPDGTFRPEHALTRAEVCTILNRMTTRTGDAAKAEFLIGLGLFPDLTTTHWGFLPLAEATIPHTPAQDETGGEYWTALSLEGSTFLPGFHSIQGKLYYINRDGLLLTNADFGAYHADAQGVLTQTATSHQLPSVPYHSQIDGINAWVGCEATATLMGLQAKGFAADISLRTFLDNLPRAATDPEKGFVGSPYVADKTKRTRTTIYPAALATYSNRYCGGTAPCADIRGYTLEELRRELLAGNCVVAYMTLWWEKPAYRSYSIEGTTQRLVSNNHAVLVYGYDPAKGYLISDPYNYHNRNQVYQYWRDAKNFETIWNERQVGMVIR